MRAGLHDGENAMTKYYAELTTRYMQGPVDHWTYVYAKDEAHARWQLEREGHEIRVLRAVA